MRIIHGHSPEPTVVLEADRYKLAVVRLREPPPNAELLSGPVREVTVQANMFLGDDEESPVVALLVLSAGEAMSLGADLFHAGELAADAVAAPEPVQDAPTVQMPVEEDDDAEA